MNGAAFSSQGIRQLHDAMLAFVARGERPAIVTLLARGDEVHADAIGTHETDGGAPIRRDTIFRIASLTKPVTAAAALMLVEQGRMALDEPIDRLVPELADRRVLRRLDGPVDDTVPARRPIVVRDLLTNLMGTGAIMTPGEFPINAALARAGLAPGPRMPADDSPEAWLARLAPLPLMDHPGEAWRYDTSFYVLGIIVARAAGAPLDRALAELVLEPLGMRDTGFHVPPEKVHRLPPVYGRNADTDGLEVFDPGGAASFFARRPGFPAGHGGLVSTADDYLAFARMMLDGGEAGGRRLLSAASVEAMTTDQVPDDVKARSPFAPGFWERRGWGYGGSMVKDPAPGEPRGFGWDGGYGTSAYWDAATGTIGILLTQRVVDSPEYPELYRTFWDHVHAAAAPAD